VTSETLASTIFKFTQSGIQSTFGFLPGQSFGLAFDSAGNLFAADSFDATIYKFARDGTQSIFAGPSAFTGFAVPVGLAFDRFGNLFVSTEGNFPPDPLENAILKFTPEGVESTFATGLNNPRGLAFGSGGNLFVAETPLFAGGDILKITPGGHKKVFASGIGGPEGNGGPEFLAIQPSGRP
jgi:sugar lactone lactonase YvrE